MIERSLDPRSLLVGWVLASACATAGRAPDTTEHGLPVVQMEEVRIQTAPDPLTGLDTYDAGDLLELGNRLFDGRDFDRALKVYEHLISVFPGSSLAPTALYNSGLCFENLAEFDQALGRFQQVINDYSSASTAKDAHYRSALCLSKLGRWQEVADRFWEVRQQENLSTMEELEARVGLGVAMFMLDDYATAEREFMSAIRFYEEKSKAEYLPAQYWTGQSRFYLGEIFARYMERVELKSEAREGEAWKKDMAAKLEEKCDLLLRAQNNFVRTIREGHTGWATAAGFRIGSMYEHLYDAMVSLPKPPDVSDTAEPFYAEALKDRIGVLVDKAIQVYERSLEMAQRVGEKNEWVERTARALERMKTLALAAIRG
ncbi:MAG: tetratricopeptide repeat protein [Deltaproteobacteria bacterium]|nr:tetratricopeptide repeat protein [Deltaproteobacteria bacterium]